MAEGCDALQGCIQRAVDAYRDRFGAEPGWVGWGPGRINIIGEHTDYNRGLAMPAAIDRWVVVAMSWRDDARLVLRSEDYDDELELEPGCSLPVRAPSWQRFAVGCVAEWAALHPVGRGLQAVVAGNVPLGAGLSSSAAVEMAWLNALRAATGSEASDLELAMLGQRVEHHHLGLASGLLDQLASQLSRPGRLMVLDFATLGHRYTAAQLPGWSWVVVESGVRRELAASAYRERVTECAAGLEAARSLDAQLEDFEGLRPEHLDGIRDLGLVVPAQRLQHVLAENLRVLAMERAIGGGDAREAGRLLLSSHDSLRDLYQVSCLELDLLVQLCMGSGVCAGARMVGGGFGGCVLALVRDSFASKLGESLAPAYAASFPHALRGWRIRLVGGAGSLQM